VTACYSPVAMSFDLTPFAPAPESRVQPAAAPGEGRTLTVPLRRAALSADAVAGSLSLLVAHPAAPDTLHAGVVAADSSALTLTLQHPEQGR
jgi:hypothetical protein